MDGAMFQVWNLSTGREEDDLTEMISESELRVSNSPGGSQVDQSPYTASGKPYKVSSEFTDHQPRRNCILNKHRYSQCKQCDNSYARQEHLGERTSRKCALLAPTHLQLVRTPQTDM